MVSEFFRADHWQVVVEISTSEQALLHTVSHEWFDVIGISVSLESQLLGLKTLVQKLRKSSGNSNVKVLLGGPIFMLVDATEKMFDADLIAINAPQAVALLKSFAAK
jgi:methanogenic corrinoid protein MtbC1